MALPLTAFMDASVIICTFNRAGPLRRTLGSIAAMKVPPGTAWEVLVVDNNSSDDTRLVVESRREELPLRYLFERRPGKSFALNRGIREAAGRIVAFTDDDVEVDPRWLESLVDAFRKHDPACAGGKILLKWEDPWPSWMYADLIGQLGHLDLGEERMRLKAPKVYGANVAVRADVFRKYGGFDTTIGPRGGRNYHNEDVEFVDRIIRAGEVVLYVPDAVVNHCIPADHMRKAYFRKRMFDQGEQRGLRMGEYRKRNILGIPLYVLRETASGVCRYVWTALSEPGSALKRQMALCEDMGFLVGRVRYGLRNRGRNSGG